MSFSTKRGSLMMQVILFGGVFIIVASGFVLWTFSALTFSLRDFNKNLAFAIAEAGIEYYRWHLAHSSSDYWDGQGSTSTGPYVHNYYDKNAVLIGQFSLLITPPPQGSTVVTVESTGRLVNDPTIQKIIRVKLGVSSFAKYAIAGNSDLRFGAGTEVFGEIMNNGGIRFDGLAHNIVMSAQSSYDDPDHGGQNEFGVHTHVDPVDPAPPAATPSRPDVFMAGRQFPVPAVDFVGITQDLADIKAAAQNGGVYATGSGAYGYDLVFSSGTPTTYSLYRVTAITPPPNGCTNTSNQDGWGTWGIQSETLVSTGTIPANGTFFIEDDAWVRGGINNSRITVGSGKFPDNPSTRKSITVNQDLRYTNYTASDTIALIAQKNFNVGLFSNDILRIDAALVAQNGRVGRYYYSPPNDQSQSNRCGPTVVRQKITLYGMIASNQRYGFGYSDSTGYQIREIIYDPNLLYSPPPNFPLISEQYTPISWEEVQ